MLEIWYVIRSITDIKRLWKILNDMNNGLIDY